MFGICGTYRSEIRGDRGRLSVFSDDTEILRGVKFFKEQVTIGVIYVVRVTVQQEGWR